MARAVRKPGVKEVPLSEIKDDPYRHLGEAAKQGLIGFESEEDWFEYRIENDPRFLRHVEQARSSLHAGRGVRLEDVKME
jgi:hypothetical protein